MWRETLDRLGAGRELAEPVPAETLRLAEERLGQSLPADLKDLLLVTNGVTGRYATAVVWPVQRIVADNLSFRSDACLGDLYMSFDPLVFFGDDGGGDQYAFVRTPERDDVFVWEHETDSRNWYAPRLERYLARCLADGA